MADEALGGSDLGGEGKGMDGGEREEGLNPDLGPESNLSWWTVSLRFKLMSSLFFFSLRATPADFRIKSSCIEDLLERSREFLFISRLRLMSMFPRLMLLLLLLLSLSPASEMLLVSKLRTLPFLCSKDLC